MRRDRRIKRVAIKDRCNSARSSFCQLLLPVRARQGKGMLCISNFLHRFRVFFFFIIIIIILVKRYRDCLTYRQFHKIWDNVVVYVRA